MFCTIVTWFVDNVKNIIDVITGGLTAFFIYQQWRVSKKQNLISEKQNLIFKEQKRDNLFKSRYELYRDIVTAIIEKTVLPNPGEVEHEEFIKRVDIITNRSNNLNYTELFTRAEYLFDANLATYLMDNFGSISVCKLGKYNKEFKVWIPSSEFKAQFDRFLKPAEDE